MGCYKGVKLFKDPANPASPHLEFKTARPAIFLKNGNGNETENLKTDFDESCSKNNFFLHFLQYFDIAEM